MYGMEGLAGPPGGGGMDASDLFEFFSGAGLHFSFGQNFGPRRNKGQDSIIPYEVTLEDLYREHKFETRKLCANT